MTVGAGGGGGGGDEVPTVMLAERCTVCPLPVQDNVKDFDAVMLVMASLPEVALLPDHEPLAVHDVAPLDVHVSVELCPLCTVVGLAASVSEGAPLVAPRGMTAQFDKSL